MNYAHEREVHESRAKAISMMRNSCRWFEAELTLQQTFEDETAKPSM
jgi:hypothetical protein